MLCAGCCRKQGDPAQQPAIEAPLRVSLRDFPGEVLTYIFCFLDARDKSAASRVCWRWWGLVNVPALWGDVTARLNLDKLSPVELASLQRRCIRHITILCCSTPQKMKELITRMSCLETLNTNRIRLTSQEMRLAFSDDLPCLTEFSLHSRNLDSSSLDCILRHMGNLQHLTLDMVIDSNLLPTLASLRSIRSIYLYHCSLWVGKMDTFTEHAAMPSVTELSLKNVELGDQGLFYIHRTFPNLHKFQVQLAVEVSADGIQKLAEMRQLQELRIVGMECQMIWMPTVARILASLRVLVLHLYRSVRDQDLSFVSDMHCLEELTVSADLVGEQGWKNLSQGCQGLRKLCLVDCARMTKSSAQCLASLQLEELQLSLCIFRDTGFKWLCQALPKLQRLHLRNNHHLTDDTFKAIALMPGLEELHILGSDRVGDGALIHLSQGKAPLQRVDLFYMENVTDRGLMDLAKGLPSLRRIEVCDCERLTEAGVSEVARLHPHLQLVRIGMAKKRRM